MHIPDGFLSVPVAAVTAGVSALSVGAALRRVRPETEPGLAPRMGVTAAYVFAAQMVNFPVAAGTSGHLLGALLAAVLVGPHAATVVMTAVFLIQAFFFLDGGHTALGANVLNMGLAGTYGGYAVYRLCAGPIPDRRRCLLATAAAAWASVMLGAGLTALELALSGTVTPRLVFPAMLGVHALIGLGEAAITVAAVGLVWRVRPDLLTGRNGGAAPGARWGWAAAGGLVLVALLAPLASSSPDGLERVAQRLGFEASAASPGLPGPLPDYSLPGVGEAGWAPIVVSLLGAGLVLGALCGVVRLRSLGGTAPTSTGVALDARVRLGCMLALVLTAVLLPAAEAGKVVLLAAVAGTWAALSRVSARWLAGRAALLLPFVGLAALSSPAFHGGGPGAGGYGLVFLRAGASLLATAAFLAGTPEAEVLRALRAYRLPRALAETLAFALRYLRVLREDTAQMLQARAARSAGHGTLALRAEVTGGIVGSLFIRSFERSERISLAMAARGYRGELSQHEGRPLGAGDLLFAAGFALLLVGIWTWR
jgi:cobalt/nickel transport system permease protein